MNTQLGLDSTKHDHGLITQRVGSETLVYNDRIHQAFCLNAIAAEVWRRFDGIQTPAAIAAAASIELGTPVTEATVLLSISELRGQGLIAPESEAVALPAPTRRDLMRQIGAGAIVMLPAVAVIMAPKAAHAYNGCADCAAEPGKHGAFAVTPKTAAKQRFDPPMAPMDPDSTDDGTAKKRRKQDGEIWVP